MINEIFFSLIGVTGGLIVDGEGCFEINNNYNNNEKKISDSEIIILQEIAQIGYNYKVLKDFVTNYTEMLHKEIVNFVDWTKTKKQEYNPLKNNNKKFGLNEFHEFLNKKDTDKETERKNNNNNNNLNTNNKNPFTSNNRYTQSENSNNNNNNNKNANDMNNNESIASNNSEKDDDELVFNSKELSIYITPLHNQVSIYLDNYEKKISQMESKFHYNNFTSLTDIIAELTPSNNVFIRIIDCIEMILTNNLKGAELLNLFYQAILTGDYNCKEFFTSLFVEVNDFIFRKMIEFIVEGVLDSCNNEFFIVANNIKDGESLKTWNLNYYIDNSNIPEYFPISIIEKVLFLGKVMNILNYSAKIDINISRNENFGDVRNKSNYSGLDFFTTVKYNSLLLNSIKYNKKAEIINEIINYSEFSNSLDIIKNECSNKIWKMLVIEKGFFAHMQAVKNILLTFEGEFFHNFVTRISGFLDITWDSRIENELNNKYFKKSIEDVFITRDKFREIRSSNIENDRNAVNSNLNSLINNLKGNNRLTQLNVNKSENINNLETQIPASILYNNFSLKLITSGFEFKFDKENIQTTFESKDLAFFGNIIHDQYLNSIKFSNTSYKKNLSGSLWNLNKYDIEEEFELSLNFILKNFTKKTGGGVMSLNESSQQLLGATPRNKDSYLLKSSQMKKLGQSQFSKNNNLLMSNNNNLIRSQYNNNNNKNRKFSNIMDVDSRYEKNNDESSVHTGSQYNVFQSNNKFSHFKMKEQSFVKTVSINFILHTESRFEFKSTNAVNLSDLTEYFLFQFNLKYDFLSNTRPCEIETLVKYINKDKYGIINDNNNTNETTFEKLIFKNLSDITNYSDYSFLTNDILSNIKINYKDKTLKITSLSSNEFSLSINSVDINEYIEKQKRKMIVGLIISSENMDIVIDLLEFSFKTCIGQIFNENINLVLVNYIPPFPMNFIFHETIRKNYSMLFNLIFPLKTTATLLNLLWIEKKMFSNFCFTNITNLVLNNLLKIYNQFDRRLNALHSELITFLNNVISFYMFDIIEPRYKAMINKMKSSQNFEDYIKYHEEFIKEIMSMSFVKLKKIMTIIFEILSSIKSFYFLVKNICIDLLRRIQIREKELKLENEYNMIIHKQTGEFFYNNINNNSDVVESENDGYVLNEVDVLLRDEILIADGKLERIREEFNDKKNTLITTFMKIKNSKYFTVISQLLTKIESNWGIK